jgi:uncharacterized membrane protein
MTSINDLGRFDQAIWGVLNGTPFLVTSQELTGPVNQLGLHFNPVLGFFAPLYALLPAPEWLIVFQTFAISFAAWPIFLIGERVFSSARPALLWALAYLVNPFVLNAASWDPQPIAFAAPIMGLTMLFLELRRARFFLFSSFLLLLTKEHFGIAIAGFGILWWIRNRTLLPAISALAIGILGFWLVLGVVMPALSPLDGHMMISQELGRLSRYGWLGVSLSEMVKSLLFHPITVISNIFIDMGGWLYAALLLLPLAFTPLLGVEVLLPAMADLAANLLSANPMPRNIFSYHSIALIPLLFLAGMYGARRLCRFDRYSAAGLGRLVLILNLSLGYVLSPLPLPGAANFWKPARYNVWPEEAVADINRLLPSEVSISAQANIGPHFAHRQEIRVFPNGLEEVDCVVLCLSSPTKRIEGNDPGSVGTLAHHLQMEPARYISSVRSLVTSGDYHVKYHVSPWLVFCRGTPMEETARLPLLAELDRVQRAWLGSSTR